MEGKKFISPGAWFSLIYPQTWNEFEDTEESFLFYNPNQWTGNFRISAYKADAKSANAMKYGKNMVKEELETNSTAILVRIGKWDCAYSKETFQEEGTYYTTHIWIMGIGNIAFECTFTVPKGSDIKVAEGIIATVEAREESRRYPKEIIPIRILEIGEVNESFEWASSTVKKQLKKDFTSVADDIAKLQQIIDGDTLNPRQRDVWESLGIAFGTILVNEIDGMDWVTVIDGKQEYPALRFRDTDLLVYPRQLIWGKMKDGRSCDLQKEFESIKDQVEHLLSLES